MDVCIVEMNAHSRTLSRGPNIFGGWVCDNSVCEKVYCINSDCNDEYGIEPSLIQLNDDDGIYFNIFCSKIVKIRKKFIVQILNVTINIGQLDDENL